MNHITDYWECFAIFAATCIISLTLIRKKIFEYKFSYMSVAFISFITLAFFYILSACYIYKTHKHKIQHEIKNKKLIFMISLASLAGVIAVASLIKATQMVNNVAYMRTFVDTIIILSMYVLSLLFLSAKFKFIPFIGILLSLSGIWIMIKYQ